MLRQTWLPAEEPDFAPGAVRTGWRGESLLLLAELTDADIYTNAVNDNERFWELGDTFEIFLRPAGQAAYLEFHVAPNNRRLQLRFADKEVLTYTRQVGSLASALIPGQAFTSQTWVQPEHRRWFIYAEIPAASVCDHVRPRAGSEWYFSFSRYDRTRGRPEPVISSTSAHAKPDFHQQAEWGLLQFSL